MTDRKPYERAMDRVSAMTEAKQDRPEVRDEDDRLQLRLDLEHHRGHIHTSYGSR